jgi:hypothetical protein
VLPLYPQYSTTTTASVADVLAARANGLDVTFIEQYATDAGWVDAVAGRSPASAAAKAPESTCCSPSTACRNGWPTAATRTCTSARRAPPRLPPR